nr:unnamed protein product [Spirometra erinaceieuropaei]
MSTAKKLREFIEEKFSSMECCNYVYDENNPENTLENPYCCCGETKALHVDASNGLGKSEFIQDRKPTRAYGILNFWLKGFANVSTNYLRLCSEDHIESVVELLVKYWKLIPEDQDVVCISFIGSALDEVGEMAFRPIEQALIETARTMNIIVIANGADSALTRNIGRILMDVKRMLAVTKENSRPPRFLGIMPWGNVCEKEKLNCRGGEVVLNSGAAYIHAYLYAALGGFYCPQYFQTAKTFLDQDDDRHTLSNPLMHIFIWSVLTNCHEMAIALLKVSPSPVASALVGAALNRHHAALLPTYDTFTRARLEEQATYFEQVASEVLMEVDSVDRELAIEMVERTEPLFQQHSYLHVGNFTNAVHFMALPPSQESLERHWNAGVFGNFFVTIFAFLMPLLLLSDSLFEFETSETFLVLLSYVLMVDMPRSGISVSEAISIGFICCSSLDLLLEVSSLGLTLGIEECRQFVRTSPWVSFKTIIYVVGWIYLAVRISVLQAYIYIRTLLGFLLILCFLRLFDLMAVSRILGPYIVIMPQMLQQFAFFLVVILIVLMPFGIGVQVLMLPYQVYSDGLLFFKIFELPYYNLFGELQLDSIKGEKDNCPSDGINCPLQNQLAQIMHAFYLLFAVVLLLNLLIAVSSAVYTELSSKAIDLWKFNQYAFLRIYKLKSAFPPPFSTVHIFLRFLSTAVKNFCRRSDYENGKRTDQGTQANSELQSRLSAVEGVCFDSVFAKFNQSPEQAVSASLARTSETLRRDVPELTREMYTWMRQLKQIEDVRHESCG